MSGTCKAVVKTARCTRPRWAAGALMAGSVESLGVIAWEGIWAVRPCAAWRWEDMPLTVILDSAGGKLYKSGPAAYLASR